MAGAGASAKWRIGQQRKPGFTASQSACQGCCHALRYPMTLYAVLTVVAALWLGWTGWHSSGAAREGVVMLAAGLSIAGASMLLMSYTVAFAVGTGTLRGGPLPDLAITLPPVAWLVFGAVALVLADSWAVRFQIIGLGVLGFVLGLAVSGGVIGLWGG
jgi:hypothetical protein